MTYSKMPLFPPGCMQGRPMCMPLFEDCGRCRPREECQCVHIENPACPGEYADVELCVDADGNLSICVRRQPRPCMPPRRPRPGCGCMHWK